MVQPACLKSWAGPGASMTPSRVMNSVTMTFLMAMLLPGRRSAPLLFELAEALHFLGVAEVLQLVELAHLDLAHAALAGRVRVAAAPFQGLLARFHLDDGVAGDEFLGLGEGAVDETALLALVFDAPAVGAGLEAAGVQQHARLVQLL